MKDQEFSILLNADKETEHLEFKEAKQTFDLDGGSHSMCNYCTALANEGGGKIILGVMDKVPRQVVGSNAFKNVNKLAQQLFDRLHRRIDVEELSYQTKRVLILHVPSRPIGTPLEFKGQYLMRVGGSLRPMTPEQHIKISQEAVKDYSSKIMPGASFSDLSDETIKELRKLLIESGRVDRKDINIENNRQLLIDLGLVIDNQITIAALVLLGMSNSLKRFIPHAEVRFGYKVNESEIRHQDMKVYSEGYLSFYNSLWEKIDSRNLVINIPQGARAIEKKALLLQHIKNFKKGYMKEFMEVLKGVPRTSISKYLEELRDEKKIQLVGNPQIVKGEKRAFWKLT